MGKSFNALSAVLKEDLRDCCEISLFVGLDGLIGPVGIKLMSYELFFNFKTDSCVSLERLIISVGSMLILKKFPLAPHVAVRLSYPDAN